MTDNSVNPAASFGDLPVPHSDAALAAEDLAEGLSRWWIWSAVAWQDIRMRYRGSVLGPFWITLSTAVVALAMGLIFSRIFHQDLATYLPYLQSGLIVWQFVVAVVNEGCLTFLAAAGLIRQIPMPFAIQAFRVVLRNLIVFAHNFVVLVVIIVACGVPIGWRTLAFIPGLLVVALNGMWIAIFLGMISARFRDVPPIVGNLIQILFFVTPIFWSAKQLGPWQPLAELNPLFAAIDIARAPLIGQPLAPYSWLIMGCMTVAGWGLTFWFFARFRSRIAYWI